MLQATKIYVQQKIFGPRKKSEEKIGKKRLKFLVGKKY